MMAGLLDPTKPLPPLAPKVPTPLAPPAIVDPFSGMKAGEQRTFRSFTGNQVNVPGSPTGMTIVGGNGGAAGMIDTYLNQGYKLPDATQAVTGAAAAGLDKVRSQVLPGEVASQSALRTAQTTMTANQAAEVAANAAVERKLQAAQATSNIANANQSNAAAEGTRLGFPSMRYDNARLGQGYPGYNYGYPQTDGSQYFDQYGRYVSPTGR